MLQLKITGMLEQELIELAKKKLLEKKYGKFDWVQRLLSRDELMFEKPRMIRHRIAEILNIEPDKIPSKTFYTWLRNLRIRWKNILAQEKNIKEDNINVSENVAADMTWKSFRPTVPVSDINYNNEPILKTVKIPQ